MALHRFQLLLRDLFEFDCAALDFGIYRIMNHKRAVIEKFISEDLPTTIANEMSRGALAEHDGAMRALQGVRERVVATLGPNVLDSQGSLAKQYHETPVGKEYIEAQKRVVAAHTSAEYQAAVYNHLYAFFSRYWQDGDFISKRRYSRKERYAIPYNGEEVYLYWANHDQYYIKTGEHFADYTYRDAHGVIVQFKLCQANVEQNSVRGKKRFFIPCPEGIEWNATGRKLSIPFEYRPLTDQEDIAYGKKNAQESIIDRAVLDIPKRVKATEALTALVSEPYRDSEDNPVSYLRYHLRQYTRRNTSDFFIHRDLYGFLSRELDSYLKNEVLNLDEMEAAGRNAAEEWFQLLRLIKNVGSRIIAFLAQIEEFQRMLWEKRKFVTECFYLITVGNIPEECYEEISACESQWQEWRGLLYVDEFENDLYSGNTSTATGRVAFLKAHPTLVLDTRNFSSGFADRLLSCHRHLDEVIDGLLVQSENWQALSFLRERYAEQVQCVYIDPPYNTAATPILYKNDYKESSWLSLIAGRIRASLSLLAPSGVTVVAIDDEEVSGTRFLLSSVFREELGVAVVRSNPAGRKTKGKLAPAHEYALFYSKSDEATPFHLDVTEERLRRFPKADGGGNYAWANFIRSGSHDRREDRPKLYYPIFVGADDSMRVPKMEWDDQAKSYRLLEDPREGEVAVYPRVTRAGKVIEKNWHRGHARVNKELGDYRIRRLEDGSVRIDFKTYLDEESLPTTWWDNREYASANYGALTLKSLFGEKVFDYGKSLALVRDCVQVAGGRRKNVTCLDYFAGSGTTAHAIISLNRSDGGRRKFVLVEMADYFDTVLVPRTKKVVFTPEWKDGRPKRTATDQEVTRSPRLIKIIRLESYEDALNNIRLEEFPGQQSMEFEDYLLSYMLKWETRSSQTLLDVKGLSRPFSYALHIHRDGATRVRQVDLAETFNYLIGLGVETRRVHDDSGRRYLVYTGTTRDGRKTAVVWRETDGWTESDYERDRAFVTTHKLTDGVDDVFVNGDSLIPDAKPLDGLFKARMFAQVEA